MVKRKLLSPDPSEILDPLRLMAQLPLQPYHVLADLRIDQELLLFLLQSIIMMGKFLPLTHLLL